METRRASRLQRQKPRRNEATRRIWRIRGKGDNLQDRLRNRKQYKFTLLPLKPHQLQLQPLQPTQHLQDPMQVPTRGETSVVSIMSRHARTSNAQTAIEKVTPPNIAGPSNSKTTLNPTMSWPVACITDAERLANSSETALRPTSRVRTDQAEC